ncbi:MAG: histidinol-phosphate transaminase [Vallitaleaceae bacterium]|nr:histidinol-phosphate transaminase [Vallitaleaceae bacterium]
MIKEYLRKDLLHFQPYHAVNKPYDVKIDANENPFSHCPQVIEAATRWLSNKDHFTRYPDSDNLKLRQKIAEVFNVSDTQVTCGVGSDQLIECIIKAFIEPGECVLVPNPSFSMYELYTTLSHGKAISYELREDFSYDIGSIIRMYEANHPKIVFICTPNNPTGSIFLKSEIKKLLEIVKCPVVIDEAYGEFFQDSMISDLMEYPQIIILKTFSKAYGLAGLRVGYAIASQEMIECVNICKPPYNLSSFSSEMARSVLEHVDYYLQLVQEMINNRELLMQKLEDIGCFERIYPSSSNFILVKTKAQDLVEFLETHKILVRGYGFTGRLSHCIRISVGTEAENKQLIDTLKAYLLRH